MAKNSKSRSETLKVSPARGGKNQPVSRSRKGTQGTPARAPAQPAARKTGNRTGPSN